MYRKLAEIAGQYLRKGSQVYLEGRIQSRKYQGKDGIERTAYDIIANEMKMLGGRNDNSGGAPYDDGYNQGAHSSQGSYQQAPQQQYQSAPAQEPPAAPARRPAPAQPTAPVDDIDDDIPF